MNITKFSINRPVATAMFFMGVLLVGLISYYDLSVDLLPNVDLPIISVETHVPGYTSLEIENIVTKPIEAVVSSINGVNKLVSTSEEGLSTVKVFFNLGNKMNYASAEIRERINLIVNTFPEDAQFPQIKRYNPSDSPMTIISAHSSLSPEKLRSIVEYDLEQPLKRIVGVANVEIKGGRKREIIVEVDHGRLNAMGLTIENLSAIINQSNLNFQVGEISENEKRTASRIVGKFENLKQIENLGITETRTGSLVQLKDIAMVRDSFMDADSITRFQGENRVMLYIQKESGSNILDVSARIKNKLGEINGDTGKTYTIETIYDQASYIRQAIQRLRNEALLGGILAVIVIFIFFRNYQSVFIISTVIPVSIITTFSFMKLFNVPLNIITISGFTLGIGMLVDNSIVVMDSILKKKRINHNSVTASVAGTREVGKAITVSTISHIVVFLPLIFLQEKIKIFYSGLFFVVSISLIVSLIVALTLIPTISSKLKNNSHKKNKTNRLIRFYRKILFFSLRKRAYILSSAILLFCSSLFLIPRIGFLPIEKVDRGDFSIMIKTHPGSRLEYTDRISLNAEKILFESPYVKDVSTEITEETIKIRVRLVDKEKREKSTREVAEELREEISSIPGTNVYFDIQQLNSKGNKIVLQVNGDDVEKMVSIAFQIKQHLQNLKGISDIVIHQNNPKPEMHIKIMQDKAGAYGLNSTQVANAVRSALTGPLSTEYVDDGKEINVRVRIQKSDIHGLSILRKLQIPVYSTGGNIVSIPIGEVCTFKRVNGMTEVHRKDRHRMVEISADIGEEDTFRAVQEIKHELKNIQFSEGYSYEFGEDYQELKDNREQMVFSFFLSVILVYMIMASLFESYVYPLTIIFSVPLGIIGSLVILFLFDKSINMPVYIGAITLAGIVVNNAIVLVDYVKLLRDRGVGKWRAIITSGESRLRPIIMTSSTTLLALLPMAIDKESGSALWSPLALTVIGGLFSSTLLTLVVLPVVISFIDNPKKDSIATTV